MAAAGTRSRLARSSIAAWTSPCNAGSTPSYAVKAAHRRFVTVIGVITLVVPATTFVRIEEVRVCWPSLVAFRPTV
jgi:hypothetical protein